MRDLTPLCLLAKKHETDKGGRHLRYGGGDSDTCHEYTPVYWDLFNGRRDAVKNVLEIGVNAGSSLRVWEEFFPHAEIIGLDIRPETMFQTPRIQTFLCNAASAQDVNILMDVLGDIKFDLIIDDGSHEPGDQIAAIQNFTPLLASGGLMIIEDIHVDCHPEYVASFTPAGFYWRAIKTEMGIGKAHCPCVECGGTGVEQLIVIEKLP